MPLQGVEYIIRAAKVLESQKDVIFQFIGKGQDRNKCIELSKNLGLKNIEFIDMMKPEDLRIEIAKSDIVLGLFGDTPKTPIVIPNKVYEALAMKKPVITADTPAIRELFDDNDMFLVPAANPHKLAQAIIELKNSPELRMKFSENGYRKFIDRASSKVLGQEVRDICLSLK